MGLAPSLVLREARAWLPPGAGKGVRVGACVRIGGVGIAPHGGGGVGPPGEASGRRAAAENRGLSKEGTPDTVLAGDGRVEDSWQQGTAAGGGVGVALFPERQAGGSWQQVDAVMWRRRRGPLLKVRAKGTRR